MPNGVPQGSVLAPLLFLVYINDLADSLQSVGCDPPLFADDTAILPSLATKPTKFKQVLQNGLDATYQWSREWRVEWGYSKCALVVFFSSRKAPVATQWRLLLGQREIEVRDHYVYLGVTLHQKLCWDMHFNRVYKAASFASWRLCRWIRQSESKGTVTVPIVRQLVLACVRSCFGYALPIWRPTQAQVAKLEQCLVRPLRYVLRLPRTVSYTGVLIECNVPDVTTWMQQLALRLTRRFDQLPADHTARIIFDELRSQPLPIDKIESNQWFLRLSLGQLALAIQAHWFGLDEVNWHGGDDVCLAWETLDESGLKLDSKELSDRCYANAVLDERCACLLSVKFAGGLSPYLRQDHRVVAAHRARLRLDRAKLNSSLFERKLVDSNECENCPGHVETVEHTLLHCRRYRLQRDALRGVLHDHNLPLSLGLILGEWPANVGKLSVVMKSLRQFLLSVQRVRGF